MIPYLRFVQRRHIAFALFVVLLLTVTEAKGVSIEYSCIRLISQDGIRQNWLANIATGQVSQTDLPNIIYQPYAISPDGQYVVYRNPQPESANPPQDHYQLVVQSWVGKPVVLQQDIQIIQEQMFGFNGHRIAKDLSIRRSRVTFQIPTQKSM